MELIQKVGARPLKKVESDDCEVVRPVKKLLSAPAFQFKGEGWYVTDYADKKGKSESKSSGESGGQSKSSSGDSSEKSETAKSDSKDKKKASSTKGASKSTKSSSGSSKKGD